MVLIEKLIGWEILDSRGYPTICVELHLEGGRKVSSAVPSGASCGVHEAVEKRDGDQKRFYGKGVLRAIESVHQKIAPLFCGKPLLPLYELDRAMLALDGTLNKSSLGANAILGVSQAAAKAWALVEGKSLFQVLSSSSSYALPVPLINIINGGAHAGNRLDIQEFMIVPHGFSSFSRAIQAASEIFHTLKNLLITRGHSNAVGDEGGFAPNFSTTKEALDYLMESIEKAGYTPGEEVSLALDVAASELLTSNVYELAGEGRLLTAQELIVFYEDLCASYPILSIEDPLAEDDWQGWAALTHSLGHKVQLVGDDLFVTHTERLEKGIKASVANAILIKPNQIGTVSEMMATITQAQKARYATIMSHRSGETEDTIIADFAVGLHTPQVKMGSMCRGERTAKYNRLLSIEQELKENSLFLGERAFAILR